MYNHRFKAFPQPVAVIHPGEFFASPDDIIIATVLGSCVAVAFRDPEAGIGGLNHFMLPGADRNYPSASDPAYFAGGNARYGMYAMEALINELLKRGCRKDRLTAKVFGGGSVLGDSGSESRVARENIDFAFSYLAEESIPVIASDVGGEVPRKILFFIADGRVLLKRLGDKKLAAVASEESNYLRKLRAEQAALGDITWFKAAGVKSSAKPR